MSFTVDDMMTLEDGIASELEGAKSMQRAINSGMAWKLPGSYGRAAMDALENGDNMLGTVAVLDAYGSLVPSRSMVQEGSKGSRERVVEAHGEAYAQLLEGVDDDA